MTCLDFLPGHHAGGICLLGPESNFSSKHVGFGFTQIAHILRKRNNKRFCLQWWIHLKL